MARGSSSDPGSSTTNTNPGSTTVAPPPPPPQSAPTGPTGTAGFSVGEGSISSLQKYATDLQSGYEGVSTQLTSQQLAVNALGVFGIPMAVAVNGSNSHSVDKAKQAAETMGKVNDGLRATSETQTNTDQFIADQFDKIVPDSGAKNPQGAPNSAPPAQTQSGPQVSKVEPPPGATDPAPTAPPTPSGPQVSKVEPPPGTTDTTVPAGTTPQGGPPVSQYTPPPGADTTSAAAAPPPQGGPPVGQYTPPPGVGNVPSPSMPTPPSGAPVGQYTPPPGAGNVPSPSMPKPPTGAPVGQYTPPPGAGNVPPPSMPSPQGGPQVNPYTPPPGTTNAAAWTPPSIPDPVAHIPGVPGSSGVPGPNTGNNPQGGSPITPMPNIPGGTPPGGTPPGGTPKGGATPAGGPRPGVIPNVPGVNGPPKGIFTPLPSAVDSLKPIGDANPPSHNRPPGMTAGPGSRVWPTVDNGTAHGSITPTADSSGANSLKPIGDANPPANPHAVAPNPLPAPPGPPVPNPVVPHTASPNIFDLLDPNKDHGAGGAWPATTIDGKPWADLSSLTGPQKDMWIDNLKNILDTKKDGAFFWSGGWVEPDGKWHSVMGDAETLAHVDGRDTLESRLDDRAIKLPGWGNTSPEGKAVWDSVSASLAHGSKGEVYVLLGPTRRPDNVFDMTEFPILEQNPNVTKVIAVDVLTKQETVILNKGPGTS